MMLNACLPCLQRLFRASQRVVLLRFQKALALDPSRSFTAPLPLKPPAVLRTSLGRCEKSNRFFQESWNLLLSSLLNFKTCGGTWQFPDVIGLKTSFQNKFLLYILKRLGVRKNEMGELQENCLNPVVRQSVKSWISNKYMLFEKSKIWSKCLILIFFSNMFSFLYLLTPKIDSFLKKKKKNQFSSVISGLFFA